MFHKIRRLNHQPVKFKIKSTLLNIDAKVIQKNQKTVCRNIVHYKNSVLKSIYHPTFKQLILTK